MNNTLITVATFQFLPEAQVSKLQLETEGLTVFLTDAETVNMDWFLGNAIGNIKLQVPSHQAEAAGALLEQMRGQRAEHDDQAEETDVDRCLECGAALPQEEEQCPACGWSYDPFDLSRFLKAQAADYDLALSEIEHGEKRTHWMWYIFPQIDGLAYSSMSQRYSIKSIQEAQAYLNHPVLGSRLLECAEAVVNVEGRTIYEIFGSPDDLKLRSCATLFASVSATGSVFDRILEKYYQGLRDEKTLELLANVPGSC